MRSASSPSPIGSPTDLVDEAKNVDREGTKRDGSQVTEGARVERTASPSTTVDEMDRRACVGGEASERIGMSEVRTAAKDQHLTGQGTKHERVDNGLHLTVNGVHVIEADADVTVKGRGGLVQVDGGARPSSAQK